MAVTTVNNGLSQVYGIKYTVITDTSADWASVSNSTYFYDKNDKLPYFKDSSGNVIDIFKDSTKQDAISIYNQADVSPLTARTKIRVGGFLTAADDAINSETTIGIDNSLVADFNSTDIIEVGGVFKLSLDTDKFYVGGIDGLATQKTLTEVFGTATEEVSNVIFHVVDNKVELLVPTGEIIVGDALNRGRSATIGAALDTLAKLVGDIFKNGIDNKLQLNLPQGYIIRGNANAEGEAQKLIQGNNKVLVTNNVGTEEEVDLVSFLDLLTATGVTANGVLNTTDLGGTARGVLGSWKITDVVVKNTTANEVTINIGSTLGGTDIASAVVIPANGFVEVPIGTALFSETVEQALYASSGNWNSANLIIKFSVKKVF